MNLKIEGSTASKGVNKTQDDDYEKLKRDAKERGEYIVSVSGDEKGLSAIARKFKMSLTDFKNMTGLTKDALQKNQVLKNIPTAKIESGMGLNALARKNGMTLKEFTELNGIDDKYKPQKGEYFYVYPNKTKRSQNQTKETPIETSPAPKPLSVSENKPDTPKTAPAEKPKPTDEPEEKPLPGQIAGDLKKISKSVAAVGSSEFKNAFKHIDKNNIEEVIKEYDNISPKESLVDMICSEWGSSKEKRKNAVMHIFDTLAEKAGAKIVTEDIRKSFTTELDEQFSSFGFVSTKKMDEIINNIINPKAQDTPIKKLDNKKASSAVNPNEVLKTTNGGKSKDITPQTMTTIKDREGNYVTAGTLKAWAISGGKRDKGFSKVKDPYIVRPLPNYNTETRKLEAVTSVLDPTSKGSLNGKVVILNPGHGGYQQKNGFFDSGTVLSVKNAEGKEMPIEEWRVAQSYTDKLADELRSRGAKVVLVSGAVKNGGMAAQNYLQNMLAGVKGDDDVRKLMKSTKKSNMLFLSVHVESAKEKPHAKQCSVKPSSQKDIKLSENIEKHIGKGFPSLKPEVVNGSLYVNNAMKGVPASLLEIGNIANEDITASLLSSYDQKKYMKLVADAIQETLLDK